MIKNYFKIAWRNLWKNKSFFAINISGLALGLTCSVLILLWVKDEYGVDAFHKNSDRTYIVTSREYMDKEVIGSYDTPGLLGEELKKVMPEVELACSYGSNRYFTFSSGDKKIKQPGTFAGKDFFKIFSYPLLQGTTETALKSPESIAISKKMATVFFGSPAAAINKTIKFESYKDLKVTAVFADIPENSSEQFECLINWDFFVETNSWVNDWHSSGPTTFVQLRKDADPVKMELKLKEFIAAYDKEYSPIDKLELGLQRYDEKYLHSNFKDGYLSGGRIEYVRLFSIVAIFILLIACINFMNLSTARSVKRAKEIGVRKVIGAVRPALMGQFLSEALLFTVFAVFISIVLLVVLLPAFSQLTGKQIEPPFNDPVFWVGMTALTIITGCIAGSYPALLLSSFKPIAVLKNNLKLTPASGWFRKGLVVFQFTLSIVFIVGMIIISRQVDYVQTKNLGYHKNNLIYLPMSGNFATNFTLFKDEALKIQGVTDISRITQRPVQLENTTGSVEWEGKMLNTKPNFTQVAVGYDFVKTMQAQMVLGRDFSETFADSANYLINETALKRIGYKDPIGKPLTFWGTKGTIVGVVKDFHFNSLHVAIEPLIIRLISGASWGSALIRTEPGKTQVALEGLEKLNQKLNPEFPFSHQFADEEYAFLYKSEQVVQKLSGYFAFLAIFISCLGLLGLVLFTAEQRTKEIGIRKVLGASVASLFRLLSKDFLILVLIAFVIATPLAWWAIVKWLENFSYRVPVSWTVFAIAGISALVIALLTISFQAIKTAIANPVKSLRTE
ncbi:MAG TPA: ABC transporter permease [Chitinophagaceae bacterium]|nr:ABC transporter permease [Chitinophagaceae bacterium]